MNLFRCTVDGSLDRQHLRTCAVYRLLRQERIGKARAVELLTVPKALNTVELWLSGPLKKTGAINQWLK